MTHLLIRAAVIGALAGGTAACASAPDYPISAAPPPPPLRTEAVAPTPAPEAAAVAHPAPDAVGSSALAPLPPPAGAAPTASAPPPAPPSAPPARLAPPPPPPTRYIATGKVVDAQRMYRDYVVRKGDHLDAIARDLETSSRALIEANHLRNPDNIQPGQHLKAPIDKTYVVVSGDTMAAIAKRFGVELADLCDLNGLPEHARLHTGDQIALPASYHDGGPVAAPAYAYAPNVGRYRPGAWSLGAAALGAGRSKVGGVTPPAPYPGAGVAPTGPLTDAQVTSAGRGRFNWPVKGEIMDTFGVKTIGQRNDGIDIRAALGTPVHAAAAGEVVYAGDQVPGFGNLVLVKHADGWVTAYAHLDQISVKMRQGVEQDDIIGVVGQSGGVSEPQLHFEVRYARTPMEKAKPVDPQLVLPSGRD